MFGFCYIKNRWRVFGGLTTKPEIYITSGPALLYKQWEQRLKCRCSRGLEGKKNTGQPNSDVVWEETALTFNQSQMTAPQAPSASPCTVWKLDFVLLSEWCWNVLLQRRLSVVQENENQRNVMLMSTRLCLTWLHRFYIFQIFDQMENCI